MKWFRHALCVSLLIPSLAFAADDPLQGVGQLMFSGRGAEAREQLTKARDLFAAQGERGQEAATCMLLGLVETSLNNPDAARAHLRQAAEKATAHGDLFGAWLALWTLAMIENQEGAEDASRQVYGQLFETLRKGAAPGARFSLESAATLGLVFGANVEMLGPMARHPELMKPILLKFAETISHDSHAKLLIDVGELEAAEEALRRATEAGMLFGGIFDGSISRHYGELRQRQWRLDDAREHYVKSLESAKTLGPMFTPPAAGNDPWMEVTVLRNLAEIELLRGRLDDALTWNDRALALIRQKGDPKREARLLSDRANLFHNAGRYDQALSVWEDTLKLAARNDDKMLQANIHGDMGALLMFQGAYGSAAKHLEKAIALYQELNESYLEAPTWLLLAEVYMLLESDANVEIALNNAKKMADKSSFKLATGVLGAVTAMRKLKNGGGSPDELSAAWQAFLAMPEARGMFTPSTAALLSDISLYLPGTQSQTIEPKAAGAPAIMTALAVMMQGKLALERRQYGKARDLFQHALTLNPNRDHKAGLLAMIGASHWAEGNRAEAIRSFRLSADALESSADDVKVEELLASYLGSGRRYYFDILIDMLISEGQPMEAFAHAERARARAFLQMVGNHRLNAATNADPRIVAEAENVRAAIAERERRLAAARPEETARLTADLEKAREHYRALVIRMKATNSEYEDLTNIKPREAGTIRQDLPPGTTLISYYVSAQGVHAWIIDRDHVQYEPLRLDRNALQQLVCWADELGVGNTRGVVVPEHGCGTAATADDAYRALFAPLRKHVRNEKLVLVPHGVLHYIPFAALRDPESGRYLVQDYTITYAPSASVLRFLRDKETPLGGGTLVLGDPVSPLPRLEALPGAKEEATFVARTLGSTPHLGNEARESLLYGLKGDVDLVHVAAHALYDGSNPLFSRIALAADRQHDGSLTVTEILSGVDLKGVNLVVLSACRSAVGQRSGGDEIVGLTRALLYAGTPGVVSTLWNINDLAAAGLMNDFYRRLGEGASVADALRHAQLAAIGSETHDHPKYWAAFMLTGDPQGRWKAAAAEPAQ